MLKDLIPLAEQIQALHREAYWQYLPKVEALIKCNIQDDNTIQALLDGLLDFCGEEQILLLFKKLCQYYWAINPQATAEYIHFYREIFDAECHEN
jgi:hypothetical protein